MNVEIGAEAALFPEKEYINGIAVAVCNAFYTRTSLLPVVWNSYCPLFSGFPSFPKVEKLNASYSQDLPPVNIPYSQDVPPVPRWEYLNRNLAQSRLANVSLPWKSNQASQSRPIFYTG
jgi:hypothetical protein